MGNFEKEIEIPELWTISYPENSSIKEGYAYDYLPNADAMVICLKKVGETEYFFVDNYEKIKTVYVAKAIKAIMDKFGKEEMCFMIQNSQIGNTQILVNSSYSVRKIFKLLELVDVQLIEIQD